MSASVVTILCAVLAIVHRLPGFGQLVPTRTIVTVIVPKPVGFCKGPACPNDGRLRRGCGMESLQSGSLFRASHSLAPRGAYGSNLARFATDAKDLLFVRSDHKQILRDARVPRASLRMTCRTLLEGKRKREGGFPLSPPRSEPACHPERRRREGSAFPRMPRT